MPLDSETYQSLVIAQVGDVDGVVVAQMNALWDLYQATTDEYLRFLKVKRAAIELLQGHVREQVNRRGLNDVSADLTDKMTNLQTMWKNVNAEVGTLEAKAVKNQEDAAAAASNMPQSGRLRTTAPISAPLGWPDANNYGGDPYRGRR